MSLVIAVAYFLLYLLLLGLCFALVLWVLRIIGVPVDPRVIQILGAIVFLLVLIWFVQTMMSSGSHPRLLLIPLGRL